MTEHLDLIEIELALRKLIAYRNALILRRRQQGATLRQIASEANLTAAGVKKILDRSTNGRNTP